MITLYDVVVVIRYGEEAGGFTQLHHSGPWESLEAAERDRLDVADVYGEKADVYIQPIYLYESEEELEK